MIKSIGQYNFSGGIFSPDLYGRVDIEKYKTAVKKMRNIYPHPHGGFLNRGGTQFITEVADSTKKTRLIPFQFNVEQAYILEFGERTIRVIMNDGLVLSGGSPLVITTTYLEEDLALLKYTQTADYLYLFHPSYPPKKLTRSSHTSWTFSSVSFVPAIGTPTGLANSTGGIPYTVTAVAGTGEESYAASSVTGGGALTWNAVSGASYYKIYKDNNISGNFGYIGISETTSFTDPSGGLLPDYTVTPPQANNPFSGAGLYPGAGTFHEQRLVYVRSDNKPQTVFGSRVGNFTNMSKSKPLRADDSYEFTVSDNEVNEIKWAFSLDNLILGSAGRIWKMGSGKGDAITPLNVKIQAQTNEGVADLQPLKVGYSAVYLESSGEVVRDLSYNFDSNVYKGTNLSVLATSLLSGYEIISWTYQKEPNSIIWAVRNDGKLLGLTYYKEHDVYAWHEHDTQGDFEDVQTIKQIGGEYLTYAIVKRIINGTEKRYIEKLRDGRPKNSLFVYDVKDSFFVDCGLSYDSPLDIEGITNADPCVITITGHGLNNGDYIDIDECYVKYNNDGTVFSGMKELNGKRYIVSNKTTDTFEITDEEGNDIDSTGYGIWLSGGKVRKCITEITGLSHLEGREVSVLANGSVVPDMVVSSGAITLPVRASRVHVGLGYYSDLETLDIVTMEKDGSTMDKRAEIKGVTLLCRDTRNFSVGPSADKLFEEPFRESENYGDPINLFNGKKDVSIQSGDIDSSSIFVRNIYPVPLNILAIISTADFGEE